MSARATRPSLNEHAAWASVCSSFLQQSFDSEAWLTIDENFKALFSFRSFKLANSSLSVAAHSSDKGLRQRNAARDAEQALPHARRWVSSLRQTAVPEGAVDDSRARSATGGDNGQLQPKNASS